jgi:hypothetical protein
VVTMHSGGSLTVTARWNDNGLLELHGHDLKPGMLGDEYEYWFVVPEDQLALVASDIGADPADRDAVLVQLAEHGGRITTMGERQWLNGLGVTAEFHSWS